MSSNSLYENFNKARDWAKNNYKNNLNGKSPINWLLIIIFLVIIIILFVIYMKYFAVWDNPNNVSTTTLITPKLTTPVAKPIIE